LTHTVEEDATTMTVATIHADRVSESLASHDVDAVVTFHMPNVRWLSGFTGSSAATIVGPGLRIFVTDSRYLSQPAEQVDESWQRHIDRELVAAIVEQLVDAAPLRVGFEAHHLTVRDHEHLIAALGKGVELTTANEAIESHRARKDPDEIAAMRQAAKIAGATLAEVISRGLIGRTEREVATDLANRRCRARNRCRPGTADVAADLTAGRPLKMQPRRPLGHGCLCEHGEQLLLACGAETSVARPVEALLAFPRQDVSQQFPARAMAQARCSGLLARPVREPLPSRLDEPQRERFGTHILADALLEQPLRVGDDHRAGMAADRA
jgi:Xaa-Pro aminopeptidase